MHRCQDAFIDAEAVVENLGHRRQAVGCARSVGDDVVLRRIVLVLIHPHHNRDVLALGRGADDDLFCARLQMGGRELGLGEQTGRLNDDLRADARPRDRRRIALGENGQLVAIDDEVVAVDRHGPAKTPIVRIVLEKVGVRRGGHEIVNAHDVKSIAVLFENDLEHLTADASESVDANLYLCHVNTPCVLVNGQPAPGTCVVAV